MDRDEVTRTSGLTSERVYPIADKPIADPRDFESKWPMGIAIMFMLGLGASCWALIGWLFGWWGS